MAQHPAHAQNHRHPGQTSPSELQKALEGLNYPSKKSAIVNKAKENNAPEDLVAALVDMPDRHFDSPAAVENAFRDLH